MGSAVKSSRMVALSAERVQESLEQKSDNTVIELISLEFFNFNRNGIRLPREAFSIFKAKIL